LLASRMWMMRHQLRLKRPLLLDSADAVKAWLCDTARRLVA
jgi:hypothetical protein